jgi:hypothetical protein
MRTTSRSARLLHLLVLLLTLALAACTYTPLNGTTVAGNVVGKSLYFQGFYNTPNTEIRLDVMKDPTLDPDLASSWVAFATTTTGTAPLDVNDPGSPLYIWEVNAVPVPNLAAAARWPQGGLVRVRAVATTPSVGTGILTTFDAVTYGDCQDEQLNQGATWAQIGMACEGVAKTTAALVSTTNTPTPIGGFLGRKPDLTVLETNNYYATIGAPGTLAQFKTKYGFTGGEITATYYNDGDLGIGREMHCKAYPQPSGAGIGIACYVTNYSGTDGQAVFNGNVSTILADAVARQHEFATVAMVADPPFNGPNSVKFMVYDAAGNRSPTAVLDSTGQHQSVPANCMSCHGINSSYVKNPNNTVVVTGAQFLPFDPFSYKFSTQAGFTFADQATAFRQLNGLVTLTQPSAGIMEFITGLYAPKLVTDPTAVANPDYVPADWTDAFEGLKGKAVYDGVVKVGCRTCHMSATNPNLDFADASDFTAPAQLGLIKGDVCGAAHQMPHAERVMKKFWASGARAYLITAFPPAAFPDPYGACKP